MHVLRKQDMSVEQAKDIQNCITDDFSKVFKLDLL